MHRLIIPIILTIFFRSVIAVENDQTIAIQAKKVCVGRLNSIYIKKSKLENNPIYAQNFQYEAEKLDFLKFLRNENKNCAGIDNGPIYENTKNAYKIECTCNHQHYMSYDYKTKKWQLIN